MTNEILTQAYVNELFEYNPETGDIVNKINRGRAKAGAVAGSLSRGYLVVSIDSRRYKVHRIIWLMVYGEFPPSEIDHINQIGDDNRLENLRLATRQENLRNRKLDQRNKSGVCGVHWDKAKEKWRTDIGANGKLMHLGRYDDWFDAVCARKSAEHKYNFHVNHGK